MLAHDFQEMPSKAAASENPHETVMLLRCKWCMKTPAKAREDGCPVHELQRVGWISLAHYNPDGLARFAGRKCVTCNGDIMQHWLRHDTGDAYWCKQDGGSFSEGIADARWDVPEGFGK